MEWTEEELLEKKKKKVMYETQRIKRVYKRFSFKLRKDTEADVIEYLEKIENKQAYIIELIKEDMNKFNEYMKKK